MDSDLDHIVLHGMKKEHGICPCGEEVHIPHTHITEEWP